MPRAQNKAFPFCNPRCKQVDLGSWLDEKYRVATGEFAEPGDDDGQASLEEES
jgi:uncharacterized protein